MSAYDDVVVVDVDCTERNANVRRTDEEQADAEDPIQQRSMPTDPRREAERRLGQRVGSVAVLEVGSGKCPESRGEIKHFSTKLQ